MKKPPPVAQPFRPLPRNYGPVRVFLVGGPFGGFTFPAALPLPEVFPFPGTRARDEAGTPIVGSRPKDHVYRIGRAASSEEYRYDYRGTA